MHTELYCKSLDKLDKKKAIQAIHQAYLQLEALDGVDDMDSYIHFDNRPVLRQLKTCLKNAGHIGFID